MMDDFNLADAMKQQREILNHKRERIFGEQWTLNRKLAEIDRELSAMAVYETTKTGKRIEPWIPHHSGSSLPERLYEFRFTTGDVETQLGIGQTDAFERLRARLGKQRLLHGVQSIRDITPRRGRPRRRLEAV